MRQICSGASTVPKMTCSLEQLEARAGNQREVAHRVVARYHVIELALTRDDERRDRHAGAVGLEVLPLGKTCATAHAVGNRRRFRDAP